MYGKAGQTHALRTLEQKTTARKRKREEKAMYYFNNMTC